MLAPKECKSTSIFMGLATFFTDWHNFRRRRNYSSFRLGNANERRLTNNHRLFRAWCWSIIPSLFAIPPPSLFLQRELCPSILKLTDWCDFPGITVSHIPPYMVEWPFNFFHKHSYGTAIQFCPSRNRPLKTPWPLQKTHMVKTFTLNFLRGNIFLKMPLINIIFAPQQFNFFPYVDRADFALPANWFFAYVTIARHTFWHKSAARFWIQMVWLPPAKNSSKNVRAMPY